MRRLLVLLLLAASVALIGRDAVPCDAFAVQPRCYVALHPGPADDSLRRLSVEGARSYGSAGELLFTTVSVDADLDAGEWIRGALTGRVQQIRREILYPPGEPTEVVNQRNIADMDRSKIDAAAAALRYLGYDVDLSPQGAQVVEVAEDGAGPLQVGDVIVEVAGTPVRDAVSVVDSVSRMEVGIALPATVVRKGRERRLRVTLREDPQVPGTAWLPVVLQDHVELPVDVRIDAGDVGGPSAGLMFSIAIVDALTPEDLTGGTVVAGTGTIDEEGRIGAVGGLRQKLLGALERTQGRPATVFLAPAEEIRQAHGAPVGSNVLVVPVSDLDDALDALARIRTGERPANAVALGP